MTSLGRRSDVVYVLRRSQCWEAGRKRCVKKKNQVPYLTCRFTIRFTGQQTIIKIDPSVACSAAHGTQNPTLPISSLCLKLPPPPCAVLPVSVNQNETKKKSLHLDGDLGCGHDIGMTSLKPHFDG